MGIASRSENPVNTRTVLIAVAAAFLLASALLWNDYRLFAQRIRENVLASLATVADLKVGELERARAAYLDGSAAILRDQAVLGASLDVLELGDAATQTVALTHWLEAFGQAQRLRSVILVDANGLPRLRWPATGSDLGDEDSARVRTLLAAGVPKLDDSHRDQLDSEVHLSAIVPISNHAGVVAGGLVVARDPAEILSPFLLAWPTPSHTAAALLARREGADAVFLHAVPFDKNGTLRKRIPLTQTQRPVVQAVLGARDAVQGIDYRGERVLAWLRPVAGSPWHLVAKIDESEALAPLHRRFAQTAAINLGFALLIALLYRIWSRERHFQWGVMNARTAAARAARDRRFRKIIDNGWEVVVLLDAEGRTTYVSASAHRVLCVDPEKMTGLALASYVHPDDRLTLVGKLEQLRTMADLTCQLELRMSQANGAWLWVEMTAANHLADNDVAAVIATLRDVSAQKCAEERAERLKRMYLVLMGTNKAIVHAHSVSELLHRVCEVAVQDGEFALAWIGSLPSPQAGTARSWRVSHAVGAQPGDAARLERHLTGNLETDFGPAAAGLLAGQRFVDNDVRERVLQSPLWQAARSAEFGAAAVLPLQVRGATFAVLGLFAANAEVFDDDEMRLLDELAADLSSAVEMDLRNQEQHDLKARATLEEKRMDALVRLSGVSDYMSEGELVRWVVEESERLTGSELACVGFADDDQDAITKTHCSVRMHGQLAESTMAEALLGDSGAWASGARDRNPVIINDAQVLQGLHAQLPFPSCGVPVLRHLSAPAVAGDKVRLVIGVANKATDYDEKDARLVSLLASATWAAIVKKRQEAALADSEARYRALFESSPQAMWIYDAATLALLLANPAALTYVGWSLPELQAMTVLDLSPPAMREELRAHLKRSGTLNDTTWPVLLKNGAPRIGRLVARPFEYEGRRAEFVLVQDVTDEEQQERERRAHAEQLRRTIISTIRVVQALGELRDPYTHGHERRVGEIAAAIAEEMGLDAETVQGVRVAGFIHDIGKIGVPSEILAKPGKLSPTEMALVRQHATAGYAILKELDFPWPVALVTLQHHERLDGSGYPAGLKGDEIALESRIVAVADTVEAMSSHRPYRPAVGLEAALTEIEARRGVFYDAQAADACLRLFREKDFHIPA